jgi:hypothetical protein
MPTKDNKTSSSSTSLRCEMLKSLYRLLERYSRLEASKRMNGLLEGFAMAELHAVSFPERRLASQAASEPCFAPQTSTRRNKR